MADYVDRFFKIFRENKYLAIVVIVVLILIPLNQIIPLYPLMFPPSSNLEVSIYSSNIALVKNQDNTTVIGFNTTVVTQITNTGKIPVTIVACDVFLKNEETPDSETLSNIKYLQPDESFGYNFTKNIEVSIPVISGTIDLKEFTVIVMYRDNSGNIKTVWKDILTH